MVNEITNLGFNLMPDKKTCCGILKKTDSNTVGLPEIIMVNRYQDTSKHAVLAQLG